MARILAVIHHHDLRTSLDNARIAKEAGCHGVMLIQMDGRDAELDIPAIDIKSNYPEMFVGTNRLVTAPDRAIIEDVNLGLDGTWTDNAGVHSQRPDYDLMRRINDALRSAATIRPGFRFFAAAAFKGQDYEPDPPEAARMASQLGWIVTTSGKRTGSAPDIDKILSIRRAIPTGELAVASGIDPQNVGQFIRHIDWILVASGISKSFFELDSGRTKNLISSAIEADGWFPIETAPRDGSFVDLWSIRGERVTNCRWYENHSGFLAWHCQRGGNAFNMGRDEHFTHWRRPSHLPKSI